MEMLMTQNPEDIQRQIAALEAQLAALKSQTSSTTPTMNEGHVEMNNSESRGVNAGVITQSTINQFFGARPSVDGESLLKSYFDDLIADCNRLRLERMTEKRQTGGEHATTPTLKLQDVYTSLTTDGPSILLDGRTGTLAVLEQFCREHGYRQKSADSYDPQEVRELLCWDSQQSSVMVESQFFSLPLPDQDTPSGVRHFSNWSD